MAITDIWAFALICSIIWLAKSACKHELWQRRRRRCRLLLQPLLCWKALLIIWNTSRNSTFSFEMHFHTKLYSARNPSRCGHLVQAFTFKIGLVFHHYRPYVYVRTFNFISICFAHVYPLCKQLDVIDNLIFSRQAVIKHRQTCADIDTWNGRRINVLT